MGALARKGLMRSSWVLVFIFNRLPKNRNSHRKCSIQKIVLKNFAKFTGTHLCQSLYFNKSCSCIRKETPAQVFSCEFCKKFLEQLFYRAPPGYCFWRNNEQKNWTCFRLWWNLITLHKEMKFSIKDLFSKHYQTCSFLGLWSHLLKNSLIK